MKIYIAGKITGEENYKENFNKLQITLEKEGHLVMNPAILPEGFEWEDYMHICYKMIDVCEGIVLQHNWKDSKGAKCEKAYAESKGLQVMYA